MLRSGRFSQETNLPRRRTLLHSIGCSFIKIKLALDISTTATSSTTVTVLVRCLWHCTEYALTGKLDRVIWGIFEGYTQLDINPMDKGSMNAFVERHYPSFLSTYALYLCNIKGIIAPDSSSCIRALAPSIPGTLVST